MNNGIEKRVLSLAASGLLLTSTIAVGLVEDSNPNTHSKLLSGQPCSLVGQQKIEPAVRILDEKIAQGVSVSECQANGRWFNDGTIYVSTNYPPSKLTTKK